MLAGVGRGVQCENCPPMSIKLPGRRSQRKFWKQGMPPLCRALRPFELRPDLTVLCFPVRKQGPGSKSSLPDFP